MGFLNRIAYGLFSPKGLRAYAGDKIIKVLLYLLFLVCVTVIPVAIDSPNYGKLSYDTKLAIREAFAAETSEINFSIEDGKLIGNTDGFYYKQITSNLMLFIGFDPDVKISVGEKEVDLLNAGILLCFLEDGVYIVNRLYKTKLINYDDYDVLEGINFNDATEDNHDFWDSIFKVYHGVLGKFQPFLSIVYIGSSFFQAIVTLLSYSVLLTWFNRLGMKSSFTFGQSWKITTYGLTAFALGNVLAIMFNFSLFYYIGIIWTLIICIISTQNFIGRGENNEL